MDETKFPNEPMPPRGTMVTYSNSGPKDDPYSVVIYKVPIGDGDFVKLIEDSFAGETKLYMNYTQVLVHDNVNIYDLFEALANTNVSAIMYWTSVWYEESQDIRDAEIACGWDDSP